MQVVHENVVRYFAPFDHKGPVYTYIKAIPLYLLPWSFVFLAALWRSRRADFRSDPGTRRVLWAITLIFVFFTLSGSRRDYYILPILPFCALLSAYFLEHARQASSHQWSLRLGLGVVLLVALVELSIPLAWSHLREMTGGILPTSIPVTAAAIGVVGIACLVALLLWRRRDPYRDLIALAGTAVVLWGSFFFVQQLTADRYRGEVPFARELAPMVATHPDIETAIYGHKPSGRLLFYSKLPLPVQQLRAPAELRRFVATGPYPKLVISFRKYDAELPAALRDRPADVVETRFPWEKKDDGKMRAWLLLAAPAADAHPAGSPSQAPDNP